MLRWSHAATKGPHTPAGLCPPPALHENSVSSDKTFPPDQQRASHVHGAT